MVALRAWLRLRSPARVDFSGRRQEFQLLLVSSGRALGRELRCPRMSSGAPTPVREQFPAFCFCRDVSGPEAVSGTQKQSRDRVGRKSHQGRRSDVVAPSGRSCTTALVANGAAAAPVRHGYVRLLQPRSSGGAQQRTCRPSRAGASRTIEQDPALRARLGPGREDSGSRRRALEFPRRRLIGRGRDGR